MCCIPRRAVVVGLLSFSSLSAHAQTYTVLRRFDANYGNGPGGRLLVAANTLYGYTTSGSPAPLNPYFTIFSLATDGTGFQSWQQDYQASPAAGFVMAGSYLFGTTVSGPVWADYNGKVFSWGAGGGRTLKSFTGLDGSGPNTELTVDGSTLYGTTFGGGPNGYGTIFSINTNGTGFRTLWNCSIDNGYSPSSALVLSGSVLFGATGGGGAYMGGTVFKINTDGSGFTVLRSFNPQEGSGPQALLLSGTTLFGTTSAGGTCNRGTVFRLNMDGTGYAVLKNFTGPDGFSPTGSLVLLDGTIYGITRDGGLGFGALWPSGNGVIYQIDTDGSGFFVLKEFAPPDGINPTGGLALSGHTLYGTTPSFRSQEQQDGTLYSLSLPLGPSLFLPPTNQVAPVGATASFSARALGARPMSYRWLYNGTNLLSGGTNSTLQVPNVQFSDAGLYAAIASNSYGAVTSAPAQLRVVLTSIVTNCTESDLRAVLAGGGAVGIATDGTFQLQNTIEITRDTSLDASGHTVMISGSDRVQVFRVAPSVKLTLANLSVAHGRNTNIVSFETGRTNIGCGGGILNWRGTVNATNCLFTANEAAGTLNEYFVGTNAVPASVGGAICNIDGNAFFERCVFLGNRVAPIGWTNGVGAPSENGMDARGGAIYSSGVLRAKQCTFSGNWVLGGLASVTDNGREADGGAICSIGSMTLQDCLFCTNAATGGPGAQGPPNLNSGGPGGMGGISRGGAVFSGGISFVTNCSYSGNLAAGGPGGDGGVGVGWWDYNAHPPRFHPGWPGPGGPGGPADGGAIFTTNQMVTLVNCTIAFNSSQGGTNGYPGYQIGAATAAADMFGGTMLNTLLAMNAPSNCGGVFIDAGHNLSSDPALILNNSSSLRNVDPRVSPLADNGGPTLSMALLPGSPAVDAAGTAAAPRADQRGFPRPVGAAADIGAYEYGSPGLLQARSSSGGVDIAGVGVQNRNCDLQSSTNLTDWQTIATGQFATNGSLLFHQSVADRIRFYRLLTH